MGLSLKNLFKVVVVAAAVATGVAYFFPALIPAGMTAAAYVTASALMAGATYTVSTLLAGTPKSFDLSQQIRGQLVTTRSPNEATRVVYGRTRLGGPILFVETTGKKNETIFMVIGIAGHTCWPNAGVPLEVIFIDDEPYQIEYVDGVGTIDFKGSTTAVTLQTTFPASILAETSAASYTFSGLQCVAVKLVYDADKFPNGLPNITFETYGKAVFDPRSDTTLYRNNAALVIPD